MLSKKIYAKSGFKINEYEIFVNNNYLEEQLLKATGNKYNVLATNILTLVTSNNKKEVSKAINNIINYYPMATIDSEIKENVLFAVIKNKKMNNINIEKLLLNLEYKFELNTAYHEFDDDIIFSDKINAIPYANSIKSLKK